MVQILEVIISARIWGMRVNQITTSNHKPISPQCVSHFLTINSGVVG